MTPETRYYCKNCGKELSENEKPCSKCGESARNIKVNINEYFPAGARATVIKDEIANEIERGTFTREDRVITLSQSKEMKDEQRKRFWLGQAISIIVVIILFIIGVLFF